MRSLPRHVIRVFGLIIALCLAQACGQKPIKKNTISFSDGAKSVVMEGPALELAETPVAYALPVCPTGPYDGHQDGHKAVEEIKGQLLREIQQKGLTQESAVQLALINNPDLFAYYENLEIGYAGLLEAGLRQNPVVSASARFPDEAGLRINKQIDTAISFLDFFLIPLRQRAAEADIRVIESEIRHKVLDLVKEVRLNWLDVKILELQLDHESKRGELKELAAGLAGLQKKAENISALSARNKEIEYEMAQERLKGLKADLETAKEKMNRSLGLFGNEACWGIAGEVLWKNDFELPDLGIMEKAAVENRPDIETIRREIDAIAQEANLKQWWTYSNLKVGTSSERDPDGLIVSGPSIELEIPIFNYGQGEKEKYHALLDQAQKRLLAKAVQACSEVREFFKTGNIYQSQLEDLENKILPDLAKQIIDGQAHYNVMTLGIFELFDLKEAEIQATIEHLQALKHYKKAKIELLHAVGGSFASLGRVE